MVTGRPFMTSMRRLDVLLDEGEELVEGRLRSSTVLLMIILRSRKSGLSLPSP